MSNIHEHVQSLKSKPLVGLLFFVLVAILSSSFSSLGMEGIFFAVLGAALIIGGGALALKVMGQQAHAMVAGKPNRMDHLLAPSGYRRRRYAETAEQRAAQSVVVPTPNRPLSPEKTVDALPDSRAVVKATSRDVMPQRLANKQQYFKACLELAPDFNPSLLQVIGRAILCLGQRGSGKSNFAALFIEQLCKLFLPAVIFDYLCDFDTLPSILPNCRIGGYPTWENARYYPDNYWEVDISNAEKVGYLIRENGGQLVIELESYPSNDYAAQVIQGVVKGLFAWANDQVPEKRLPALVVLDEAQQFLPQNVQDTENKETTQSLLRTFKRLNEVGRHYGLTPAIFTQRAARINKDVIGGTEIYVLMRQTMPQDLQVCEELLGKKNVDRQKIASFGKGDALVFEGGESFEVHFDLRQSLHKSSMPDPHKVVSRYQGRDVQKTLVLSPSYEDDPLGDDLDEDLDEDLDNELETEDLPLASPVAQRSVGPVKQKPTELERCLNAYREGATTQAEVVATTGIKLWDVRQLWPQLKTEIKRLEDLEDA